MLTCALLILYSLMTDLMAAGVSSFRGTEFVIKIPPFSFFEIEILGGFLFSLIPKPSNSFVKIARSTSGFRTSRTMKMRLQVRATAMTCLPRPFPSCKSAPAQNMEETACLGSCNNSWKIKNLDLCAVMRDLPGHGGQGS